ncbi:hypothetical protein GCM10027261_44730 [Geodermatophilus arenarius]
MDADPVRVQRRIGQRGVEEGQHVGGVPVAPGPDDGAGVLLPVAGRAARVALHDRVARRHVHLRLVQQRPAVLGERPAVHQQQHRVRARALRRRHPAVHRGAVGGRGGALGAAVQPAGGAERGAEAGEQPAPAGRDRHQLPRRPVVRHGGDDDPAPGRDPAHGERPLDQRLGRAAVEGHPQQRHRAAPLDADQRRSAAEHRRRRLVAAVGVPRVEHGLQRAAGGRHPAQRQPAPGDVEPVGAQVRAGGDVDPRPGRVERRQPALAAAAGDPARLTAADRDQPDVADAVSVGSGVPRGDERERAAVGRPGDVGVLAAAVGELPGLGRVAGVVERVGGQVEDEHAAGAVGGVPEVVDPVAQPGDQPRRLGLRRHVVGGAVAALLGHAGHPGQPAGVR